MGWSSSNKGQDVCEPSRQARENYGFFFFFFQVKPLVAHAVEVFMISLLYTAVIVDVSHVLMCHGANVCVF